MDVNYYLKDKGKERTALICVVRYKGNRYKLAPGITVPAEFWDKSAKHVLYKKKRKMCDGAGQLNVLIDRHTAAVQAAFEPYILGRTIPTILDIKKGLKNKRAPSEKEGIKYFTPYFKVYADGQPAANRKGYNTTFNFLGRFEKEFETKLTFLDVNLMFYENFKAWMMEQMYIPKKGAAPKKYSLNYFGNQIKNIKAVMNSCGPESALKYHSNFEIRNRAFRKDSETSDAIYLSVKELLLLHNLRLTPTNVSSITENAKAINIKKKIEAMTRAKNKFLIGAFTALRVSDFNRLEEVNVSSGFLTIHPEKGRFRNEPVIIPIHPVIREILNSGFDLSTPVSSQKINKHIKEAAKLAGIIEPVIVARTEGGRVVTRTFKKYELVSTHTARRSGATNMYIAGIPSIAIMKITGHHTESSFLKYIKVSQEENARALSNHPFFK